MKKLFGLFLLALAFFAPDLAHAANRFAVCTTTCTWDGASTAMWSTSTGGATGASVPGSSDAVILDAATCVGGTTCTITVNTNFNVVSVTMGACTASTTGCVLDFTANNNSPTMSQFSCTGTGTRVLSMGNGTWTIAGGAVAIVWNCDTVTNMTFNANSSTLAFSATGANQNRTFNTGGRTYNAVTIAEGTPSRQFTISNSATSTINTLAVTAPVFVTFTNTTIISTAPAWAGTAGTSGLRIGSSGTATISVPSGTANFSWLAINGITFTGGATFNATNSFDLGGNTGITITGTPTSAGGGRIIGG